MMNNQPGSGASSLLVADLFSGAGGMSFGFHQHPSYRIIGAVDKQLAKPSNYNGPGTSCNLTYERNIGVRPLNEDLFEFSAQDWRVNHLGLNQGELDVLISCAPCTGFSQKNSKNHSSDDLRNSLINRSGDFVAELMPRVFVMENVKELLQGRNKHHFDLLHSQLEDLGYSVSAEVHDLVDFGLPQFRRRVLLLAYRDGLAPSIKPPPGLSQVTVRDVIEGLPAISAGEQHPNDSAHVCPSHNERTMARIKATPRDGGSWHDLVGTQDEHLLIPSMLRPGRRLGSFPDVYGRLWWDQPARTITRECAHPGNGRYLHPEQDRMLSVREMALLQGFPPDYIFEGNLINRYNQVGDAVPPLIASMIANDVAELLK